MKLRNPRSLVIVVIFVVITGSMSALVGLTLGRFRIQDSATYHAMFTDISGLHSGVDVRAAGVTVGSVKSLKLRGNNQVEVTFTVEKSIALTEATDARIRWANLTGDRYLDLVPPSNDSAARLASGGTIPVSQTQPALDLDVLFNGFKPLIQALSPKDVNQLTASIISITQGQSGAVNDLLSHVGSFTSTIAARDQLIGDVITNLQQTVQTVNHRQGDFDSLITGLAGLLHGLAKDRRTIGTSISRIGTFAGETQALLKVLRPEFTGTVKQVERVSKNINSDAGYVNGVLSIYPEVIQRLGRGGTYGSFFNFYLCAIRVKTGTDALPIYSPFLISKEPRCIS
jgi:phospholipid/cholesterol/gamma-HCH transport system substrate-binding protein